ncbi:N-acetylglutamate synthase-like GNAT family acetyltransferase [Roseibium hamelinense]|uniref:N-acetylglutamate synthase-like GNAT family acetyltransferase n=1 Tax=Roseibium hamelinense TaxID=150831 RepID=A0A562TI75_9HYPH|nr:GNAT family N-acetyltransferase [Roseibium hamelinense]TWI93367.1 N-acetylglutamate synthase-like GNAT family acetyltransferase [Roseibium hamelinense]
MSVRQATTQDTNALKLCIDRAYAPFKAALPDLPEVSSGLEEDIQAHSVFVAETGGRIAGGAVLVLDGETAVLFNVAVDPDHGEKGIGRRLIEACCAQAAQRGYSDISLATHAAMPDNVALYRHLGWLEYERSGNKVRMHKPLGGVRSA